MSFATPSWHSLPFAALRPVRGGEVLFIRKANLAHAAASLPNIMQGSVLVVMLPMILVATAATPVTLAGVHPVSGMRGVAYVVGVRLVYRVHRRSMWSPKATAQTREDQPHPDGRRQALAPLVLRAALLAVTVTVASWLIARTGLALAAQAGLSHSAVGGVLTAVSTSLPELVTTLSAVWHGALTLAVGHSIGGKVFDTLLVAVAVADVAYRDGSVLHADGLRQIPLVMGTALLQTGFLLAALIQRERRGLVNVGIDSIPLLAVYVGLVMLHFAP